ncbi:hypothetical protein [Clostridium sp. KNHs205]|jgi:predicted HAD superfamily hydrolase|uniref:hypothetical protein n=1 Tax=Clostridium sp. KNHs205 TaxID=1449050 RepID=UPI00051C9851|nr:hypothetical protein [Clostridium sp. KNHs205]
MKPLLKVNKKTNTYLSVLKKNKSIDYYSNAYKMITNKNNNINATFYDTSVCAISPILISYVIWILKKAEKSSIKHLFFLARDGQIMYKIACIIVKKCNIDIELHYLYCSRISLRIPLFYINQEEAINKMFLNSAYVTISLILDRVNFTNDEKKRIYNELNILDGEANEQLTFEGIKDFRIKLCSSQEFYIVMNSKSKLEYDNLIKYFEQEGLFKYSHYAIVDSGWVGSMQRSLRILLQSKDPKLNLEGYYFGLYGKQNELDGIYNSFYFSHKYGLKNSVFFNNNLFECICSADHGITLGYREENGIIIPVLNKIEPTSMTVQLHYIILEFCNNLILNYHHLKEDKLRGYTYSTIKLFMVEPSKEELDIYGNIHFCDDVSEKYMLKLAADIQIKDLIYHIIPVKLFYRLIYRGKRKNVKESYWMWGTISRQNILIKWIFKLNYIIWQSFQWIRIR